MPVLEIDAGIYILNIVLRSSKVARGTTPSKTQFFCDHAVPPYFSLRIQKRCNLFVFIAFYDVHTGFLGRVFCYHYMETVGGTVQTCTISKVGFIYLKCVLMSNGVFAITKHDTTFLQDLSSLYFIILTTFMACTGVTL